MKQFDIIALGELNVDLILNQIESEPEIGKEKFAKQMTLTLGSSTAIFAANAAALGAKVAFCGMIGNDSCGYALPHPSGQVRNGRDHLHEL